MKIEEYAKNALVNYGAILPNWGVEIIEIGNLPGSDWADVTCFITRPKCRKPYVSWTLRMNMVRQITDFSRSTFTKL